MLNVMLEKRLVSRQEKGKAHIYMTRQPREKTLGRIAKDVLVRAFEGSAATLVTHVLDQSQPSEEELIEIQRLIDRHVERKGS